MVTIGAPKRICYPTRELFNRTIIHKLANAISAGNYDELNKILNTCTVAECGPFFEIPLVASILRALFLHSGIDYSLSIGMICEDEELPAALAISTSGKTHVIYVKSNAIPSTIDEATVAFYTFAILHELVHMAVNHVVLWKKTHDYLVRVYYDRPDIMAKLVNPERFKSSLTLAIEATTNSVTYTYYLAAVVRGKPIRYLYNALPIVPIPGVVWAEHVDQAKIAEYLRHTELASSSELSGYLIHAPDRIECLRDWLSHAVDFSQLDAFFNDCVSKGNNPAKCWWEKIKYMWNSYILIPAKVVKLIENVNIEEDVKLIRAHEVFNSFDKFKEYMAVLCGYDENTSKRIWDNNEVIEVEVRRIITTVGKTGKQCKTETIERAPLCRGAGEGECPALECPKRPPQPTFPPPPTPVLPGVGDMPIEDLFKIRETKVRVPIPEPVRKLMGEETRITWKER